VNELVLAVATDDGENLIDRHFGDAEFYYLYRIAPEGSEFIKSIAPREIKEDESLKDGDPAKAKGVAAFLRPEGVVVTAARAYGPNIKRIKQQFVCVLVNGNVEEAVQTVMDNFSMINDEWGKGEDRNYLTLRK
jgi:predicted Fe-Mo cluster-binding NifX family protein